MEHNILFEFGIVLFIGFFSALLTKKLGQSVIIGYIVAGVIIGPFGLKLVRNTEFLKSLSEFGIVFLMFFLGLEFSINKFSKIKNSVLFIGTYEVFLNLIFGFAIGIILGFSFIEKLFLTCIIALSSSGVVAKLLFEMKRTANKESEILMGVMVYEDFIAIVILGILSSFAISRGININSFLISIGTAILFYITFILIGLFIINKILDILVKLDSQELFTALMLGIILLIGALAHKLGLSAAAGSFLLGMIIINYDIEAKLHKSISPFKDIFLLVFFISFGMLLDPSKIVTVLWLVAIIAPLTILGELIITSSSAYFSGFSSEKSITIGSSMISRGEYSLIYATIGFTSGAISESLYQFTGVYVFIMTLIAPIAMKKTNLIHSTFKFIFPNFIKQRTSMIASVFNPLLLANDEQKEIHHDNKLLLSFVSYGVLSMFTILMQKTIIKIILIIVGIVLIYYLRNMLKKKIYLLCENNNPLYCNIKSFDKNSILKYTLNVVTSVLLFITASSAFWTFGFKYLLCTLGFFLIYIIIISFSVKKKLA